MLCRSILSRQTRISRHFVCVCADRIVVISVHSVLQFLRHVLGDPPKWTDVSRSHRAFTRSFVIPFRRHVRHSLHNFHTRESSKHRHRQRRKFTFSRLIWKKRQAKETKRSLVGCRQVMFTHHWHSHRHMHTHGELSTELANGMSTTTTKNDFRQHKRDEKSTEPKQ